MYGAEVVQKWRAAARAGHCGVTTEGAELVALRLQDAQAMFSGEDVSAHRHKNSQPFTQLGKFHFKPWKPTYHATALPRHVDEALFHSLKRSKLRVSHAKVCGGGGSRLQNVASPTPSANKLTQEDYEHIFADEKEVPTSQSSQPETTKIQRSSFFDTHSGQ